MDQTTALDILKCGLNVFLTGEPGSGKSFLINSYVDYLRRHGVEPAVTASTGVAATHLGGLTIHSWSGVGTKKRLTQHDLDYLIQRRSLVQRLKKTSVLIVDEVSMLDADILDSIDLVTREIRNDQKPFGGLQVIFVGDFFQLPPVGSGFGNEGVFFAWQAKVWSESKPVVCYLNEQWRHDDQDLRSILSGLRSGLVSDDHRLQLKAREVDPPGDVSEIYTHNIDVDRINDSTLRSLAGLERSFVMTARGSKTLVEGLKRGCLSPEILRLKIGAKVMFTKNNFDGGYVNGTLGLVKEFDQSGYPTIEVASRRSIKVKPADWVIEDGGRVKAQVTQLPLRLAWAITVHKSQGMTLETARVDLRGAFEYGQGYVAISRVRNLSGLYLSGLNERSLQVHPEVVKQDRVFRSHCDTLVDRLRQVSVDDMIARQRSFIEAVAGTRSRPPNRSTVKVSTYERTKQALEQAGDLATLASVRGLSIGTICSHLEKLSQDGAIKSDDIRRLWQGEGRGFNDLKRAVVVFQQDPEITLSSARSNLKKEFSFEELRLARSFYKVSVKKVS